MPHPGGPYGSGEPPGHWQDDHQVAAQGDGQGGQPFSQPLQGSGEGHRHRRDHKAKTDHPQGDGPHGYGLRVSSEQAHELGGDGLTDHGARRQDQAAHPQHHPADLADPADLPGAVVVAHQGAHPLDKAVGREVEEGLELVIDPQHQHVPLGEGGQNPVEGGHQHRG